MKCIRVAAAALNQTPLAWDRNKANVVAALRQAREIGATFLCLPELCLTGYGCEDAFLAPNTLKMAERVLEEVLPETRGMVVSLGLPVEFGKAVFNACCLVADGKPRGVVAKHALAGDGLHYEPRWFKPWPLGQRSELTLCGAALPFGDLEFCCGGIHLAFEICEDAWGAHRPAAAAALGAADVVFNPSASHFAFGKHEIRKRLVLESSRAFGVCYVYANLLGNEAGRAIYDGDSLIASHGRLLAQSERFLFSDVTLVSAVVDVELIRFQQARLIRHQPEVPQPGVRVTVPLALEALAPEPAPEPRSVAWENGDRVKEEEFTRAVALGLFDYLRKSRARGFVISLSGGADSAAVACLARFMLRLATAELGLERVHERLGLPQTGATRSEAEVARSLVTTVYQATKNSSELTKSAAAAVARALDTEHHELDVSALVTGYENLIAGAVGRPLTWEQDDVSLQNIQARARAPGVWLLANLKGALLLSTSNRSEAAVGYATMDGDTAGGLSPIAGIDKAFLRRWLVWVQSAGPSGIGPVPELAAVNRQAPTAELRPPGAEQTDEGDLMPYGLLDAIERSAIRDKRGPIDVFVEMRALFPGYSAHELGAYVERFFVLWSKNQWKRERYAPSFHVDDANLDPKTWCRFPILSGGFERELAELRAFVQEAR